MTSEVRRRAHLHVGAATVAVFLLFLLLGVARGGANASSSGSPPATQQSTPGQPDQVPPYGYRRGFGRRGFGGGGDFGGGPPGGGPPTPSAGGDSSF